VIDHSDIEDVYELSPLQQGLLFHSLLDPSSGFYVDQYSCLLEGDLDVDALEGAWQDAVDAHGALRGSFHWRDLEKPLQVVHRNVPVRFERHDWQSGRASAPESDADREFTDFLVAERARGFDMAVAPLMRWSIARVGEARHRFVWSFHHLLLDGWSLQLVLAEAFARFDARVVRTPFVAPATRPDSDYVAWLQQQDPHAAEAFWRDALAGFQRPTRLGMSANAVAEPSNAEVMDEEVLRLPARTTADVLARAREWKVTPNAVVLSAWSLLLARYADERDVVVGTVSSGRPAELPGVESMVGAFANTLPVRVPVDPDAQVRGWVTQVQARQMRALQYQWSSLVDVQGWSEVPRGTPLFENLFIFQNAPAGTSQRQFGGVAIEDVRFRERTHFPLTLWAALGERLTLMLFYDRRRFSWDIVRNTLRQLATLIEAIAQNPEARLRDLPLIDAETRRRALVEWNATGPGRWQGPCVPELFAARAACTPNAIAVSDGRVTLSYRDLHRRSDALAHRIREAGAAGRPVGVCLPRSTDLVVALVGVLKAGCAYLPLDPRYPEARLRHLVEDSGAAVVLTAPSSAIDRAIVGVPTLHVSHESGDVRSAGLLGPRSSTLKGSPYDCGTVTPDHLAYMIYTSGSTGRPKGVMLTHGGLANHLADKIATLGLTANDVVAQTAPHSFDVSVWQMLAALLVGARVEVFTDDVAFEPAQVFAEADRRGITVMQLVPSLLRAAVEYAARSGASAAPLRQLRWMTTTGEALPVDLCRAWFAYQPRVPVVNCYGPTECTDDVAYHIVRDAPAPEDVRVPIGRVVTNMRVYVLDASMQPVAPGLIGELFVGGAGIAHGYLGKPDLTAGAFVPDPFGDRPGARLYRTGDLVRQSSDGRLDFMGRRDHQVKIRGYRIELDEIRSVLAEHAGVHDCAVVARKGDAQGDRLVAYVVAYPHAELAASALRETLRRSLPEYMVPSAFVFLDALPLNANGKLDRAALPEPAASRPEVASRYLAPRTPLEQTLTAIWEELLGLERLGVSDNFFELGGHSLLAMRLLSRVNETFGVDLSLRQVFDRPTVADLTAAIVDAQLDAMADDELNELLEVV
jgi:amino acid adenylation domain-containing protein